jgi:hypothetical protein
MIKRLTVFNEECNACLKYEYEIKKSKYETCVGNKKTIKNTIQYKMEFKE